MSETFVKVNPKAPDWFKSLMGEIESRMGDLDKKTSTAPIEQRSKPGEGDPVYIVTMGPAEEYEDDIITAVDGVCCVGSVDPVEDYANSILPIQVKVRPGTDQNFVIKALRQYADSLVSAGGYEFKKPVDDDCPF